MRKSTLYSAGKFGWGILVAGTGIAIWSGQVNTIVSPSQLPQNPFVLFGGVVILIGIGWLAITSREKKSWLAAGRAANLSPDGAAPILGTPALAGDVYQRPVRARTVKRQKGSGSRDGSSRQTFTVVEAELAQPADDGLIVTSASGSRTRGSRTSIEIDPEHADLTDDQLAVIGRADDVAQAVISGRSRDALLAMDEVDIVYVGDATQVVSDMTPNLSESRIGSWFEGKISDRIPGDASTVSVEAMGVVHDGDRLRRPAEAVAAVADAFEAAPET